MERSRRYLEHGPVVAHIRVHADGANFVTIEAQLRDTDIAELVREALEKLRHPRSKSPSTSVTAVNV
mgnify:CR=1 FL=1